jgi:hypothetical protein
MAVNDSSKTKRRDSSALADIAYRKSARLRTARAERDPPRGIDRELPHQVEISVSSVFGLGVRPDAMYAFCRARGYRYATHGTGRLRIERDSDGICWCFTDAAHADAFHAEFGGERLTILSDRLQQY